MNNRSKDIPSLSLTAPKQSMPAGHESVYDLEALEYEKSRQPGVKTNTDGVKTNTDGVKTNTDGVKTNTDGVRQDPLEVSSSFARTFFKEGQEFEELLTEPLNNSIFPEDQPSIPNRYAYQTSSYQTETDTKSTSDLSLSAYYFKYGFGEIYEIKQDINTNKSLKEIKQELKSVQDNQDLNKIDKDNQQALSLKPSQPRLISQDQIDHQSHLLQPIQQYSAYPPGNPLSNQLECDMEDAHKDIIIHKPKPQEQFSIFSDMFEDDEVIQKINQEATQIEEKEKQTTESILEEWAKVYKPKLKLSPILKKDEDKASFKSNEKLTANKILSFLKKLSDYNQAIKINLNANFVAEQELDYGQLALDDKNLKTGCFASCFARLCYRQKNVSEEYPNNATADLVIPGKASEIGFFYQNKFFIFENFNDQESLYDDDYLDQQSFSSALEEYLKGDQDQRLKIIPQDELSTTDKISSKIKNNILSQLPQSSPRRNALSIERTRVAENSSLAR